MPGSFGVSRDALEQQVRDQRAVDKFKREQQANSEAKEEAAESAREQEINAKLPETVNSDIYGTLKYADFKQRYAAIWDQVSSKEYLTQRVRHSVKFGATLVSVRGLTKREQKALTLFEPVNTLLSEDQNKFREQQMEYVVLRLIVQLEQLGDVAFPDLKLTPESRESWRSDTSVKQRYEYLLDMDPIYISQLLGLVNDMDQAKYFALLENLKNP